MEQTYVDQIARSFRVPPEHFVDLVEKWKPPSEIVPDNVQCELIMLREKKRDIYFRIGDIANELILMHKGTLSNKKVYEAMSPYCDSTPRTIRYYAETAAFFSQDVRNKHDVLPFSHFDLARNYGAGWGLVLILGSNNPSWSRRRLEKHVNNFMVSTSDGIKLSKNPMCDSVRGLSADEIITDESEGLVKYFEKLEAEWVINGSSPSWMRGRPIAPAPINSAALIGEIAALSEKVIQLLNQYGERLPEAVKEELTVHLVGINNTIPTITVALDGDGAK